MPANAKAGVKAAPKKGSAPETALKLRLRNLTGDLFAGTVIATSNIALAVSFAAAIFQGDLAAGFAVGTWIMLLTMVVVGLAIGMLTTLPPIAGGPDTAVIAVIGLFAPAIAGPMLVSGVPLPDVLVHVMIGITLVAIASGATLLLLGASGLGQSLRFVPYPLVAGFLAATGILLVTFSIKIVTGERFDLASLSTLASGDNIQKIGMMLAFAFLLGGARRVFQSPLTTPVVFFGFALAFKALLESGYFGEPETWYLWTEKGLEPWVPLQILHTSTIDWPVYITALPELATCVIVGLISLIVRISTFESSRMAAADINHELRIYGAASLASGLAGGMTGGILFSTSKFLAESSARTRFVYVIISAILALTIFADLNLAQLVPTPILGGFLLLLGYSMTVEALKVTLRQRSALEVTLTCGILVLCLWLGFIVGVLAGFIAACLLFAFSYARIGVIRRHSTRRRLSAATERASDIETVIRENGDSIHLYELEGYVFFGSSEAVFEQIRHHCGLSTVPIRSIILDLSRITGYDSSAANTLNKLRGYSKLHAIELIICGMDHIGFKQLFANTPSDNFTDIQYFTEPIKALDWAEEHLLESLKLEATTNIADLGLYDWLSAEFGIALEPDVVDRYFERTDAPAGRRLYAQGNAADTIDFVVSGTVAMMLQLGPGQEQCVRRSSRQTVIGEMGFFRETARSASVVAETATVLYSLSRANFEGLRHDHPLVHDALLHFVIRILADRLDMASAELTTMRHADIERVYRD